MKVKGLEPLGFRKGEKHCLVVSAVVLTGCDGQVSGESVTQCRSRRPARNCPWCDAHCGIPGAEQAIQLTVVCKREEHLDQGGIQQPGKRQ